MTLRIAEDHRGKVLQVDLVDDSGIWRHHAEIAERGLAPAEQDVALAIALEFEERIEVERIRSAEVIHLDGVVDHQVGGQQRIGAAGIAAHGGQSVTHRGQIHHAGHAGEILQQDARRHEADLFDAGAVTARHGRHILCSHALAVFIAQQILQQNPYREGQAPHVPDALLGEVRETEVIVIHGSDAQFRRGAKAVFCHWLNYI